MTKGAANFFKLTIRDVPIEHQTVLLRTDFNVPLDSQGEVSDDLRIRASLPTIKYLMQKGCKIVIISHLGRPDGRELKYSLEPAADRLAKLLKHDVLFVNQTVGDKPRQAIKRAPKNSIIVLENLRFNKGEEDNDSDFAARLAKDTGARYFVQDGFGVVHRAHASTSAITNFIPSVAGLLLEKEYQTITNALKDPKRPLVAALGGAKISDKIKIIERFVDLADRIIIGGAMANTFLAYKGLNVGKSKYESLQPTLDKIYQAAAKKVGENRVDEFIVLPTDVAVSNIIDPSSKRQEVDVNNIKNDDIILDIGQKTAKKAASIIGSSGTVIWNGTFGYAELPEFADGSAAIAVAMSSKKTINSIVGGGDTADFVLKWQQGKNAEFSHISTGGGASLDLMAGLKLPGVESLLDARA